MNVESFYRLDGRVATRTLEEWADYISSPHYYQRPDVSRHCGTVCEFLATRRTRGFAVLFDSGEKAFVTTRYMTNEEYTAIERYARMAVDLNARILIEGVLGYDSFGMLITQVENVWLGDESSLVFRLARVR